MSITLLCLHFLLLFMSKNKKKLNTNNIRNLVNKLENVLTTKPVWHFVSPFKLTTYVCVYLKSIHPSTVIVYHNCSLSSYIFLWLLNVFFFCNKCGFCYFWMVVKSVCEIYQQSSNQRLINSCSFETKKYIGDGHVYELCMLC